MEKFTVSKISEETTNGNNILTLTQESIEDLGLYQVTRRVSFCMAIIAGSHELAEGQELEIPMERFEILSRPFTNEKGETINVKWLSLK